MGLTFSQKFYHLPDTVYLVQFLEPGDLESARDVFAILEVPEDKDKALDLSILLESNGYCAEKYNFDELVNEGYDLLKELGVKNRYKQFGIY